MDSPDPSPVTLVYHCRFEFTNGEEPGVLEQNVYLVIGLPLLFVLVEAATTQALMRLVL